MIVRTALEMDKLGRNTTVVASDKDILVVFVASANEEISIKMLTLGSTTSSGKISGISDIVLIA